MAAAVRTALAFKVESVFVKAFFHDALRLSQTYRFENPEAGISQLNNQREVGRRKHDSFSVALHKNRLVIRKPNFFYSVQGCDWSALKRPVYKAVIFFNQIPEGNFWSKAEVIFIR